MTHYNKHNMNNLKEEFEKILQEQEKLHELIIVSKNASENMTDNNPDDIYAIGAINEIISHKSDYLCEKMDELSYKLIKLTL